MYVIICNNLPKTLWSKVTTDTEVVNTAVYLLNLRSSIKLRLMNPEQISNLSYDTKLYCESC